MAHFAFFCLPFYSHLRIFEALARTLRKRGHRVTLLVNAGAGRLVADAGLSRVEMPSRSGDRHDLETVIERAARPNGPFGILRTVADTVALSESFCAGAPQVLQRIGADAIVGDQMEPAVGLVAEYLRLPFASIAAALPINPAPGIPLPFLDWPFDPSQAGLKRNAGGDKVARLLLRRQRRMIARWADRFGLSPRADLVDCLSPTLQIAQTVPAFDFPRPPGGPLQACGPLREVEPAGRPLPFVPRDGRHLVFASLGTLQGHRLGLFRTIAAACRALDADLVVAHCGGLSAAQARGIDAHHVTDFLPQTEVLARASVCVTHGGLNTVLDALGAGVPVLALPIAFDQRGVAARIVHHGVGESVRYDRASVPVLRDKLARLLNGEAYRRPITSIRRQIETAGGLSLAAELIERALVDPAASQAA